MTRDELLDKAKQCVNGDRDHDYGGPERSFDCIAKMWAAYLAYSKQVEISIAPADVAAMMAMLKLARIAKSPEKDDSWIDLAGYAACGAECADQCSKNGEMDMRTIANEADQALKTHCYHHCKVEKGTCETCIVRAECNDFF